ncbi:cadherin-like domain-containing protein [Salinibacter altiplanensis]|uniref:cadherin-like domain-containing protein n=1 Tax=Salinibacter altiplanensis TaxID=1803181 RepID=UPI001F1F359B|nr:cadherin-like domain-containing protein [Salinibacter altiplanensis]
MMDAHLFIFDRRAIRAVLLVVLVGGLGVPLHTSHAQEAHTEIPLTVRNAEGNAFTLTLGLDSEATSGLDPKLGEREQPPVPPSEVFDVRLVDDNVPASGFGEGLLKDIRPGDPQFEGTRQHEIRFQAESGEELTIVWDLPAGVTGTIQDVSEEGAYGPKGMRGNESLTVDAGAPNAIVTLEYTSNQAPTLDTNTGITLLEGGLTTVTTSALSASDPDDAPSSLTYTVTAAPTRGNLLVDGRPASTFTQADLSEGSVQYDHTAADTENDDVSLFVEDASGKRTPETTVSITVDAENDAPAVSLAPPAASIAENNSPPTTVSAVSVTDDNLGANELSLGGPDAGSFALTDADSLVLTESADTETRSSYAVTVTVNDPDVPPSPNDSKEFSLRVEDINEPPILKRNAGLALSSGSSATLTTGELSASDPDDAPSSLTYTVIKAPTRGDLLVDGRPASAFTQADLSEGAVQYRHTATDGKNDRFTFVLEDEAGAQGTEATTRIAVNPSTHRTTITGTDGTRNDTGWRLLAPPSNVTRRALEDDLAFGINAGALLYTWDDTRWTPATDSSASLPRGRGFILYFFDDEVDPVTADGLTLEIPDLKEDQTADVTVDGLDARTSLHLLGNPYDTAFHLGDLAGGDLSKHGFQNTVQVWDPSGGGQWTLITQGGPDDIIPAWQGFFVERARTGRGKTRLTFGADGRQSDSGDLIGSQSALLSAAQDEQVRLDLSLTVEGTSDTLARSGATVLFRDGADAGWDAYEATQLPPPTANTYATLSSPLQRDGTLIRRTLASEPPPARNETLSYPLSVRSVGTAGTATVRWPESTRSLVPRTWTVELLDRSTGAVVDLREAPYTFDLAKGAGVLSAPDEARFALRLTPKAGVARVANFSANPVESGVRLTWETTTEINNTGFHVQRRNKEGEWKRITFVESSTAKSPTTGPQSYRFTDRDPPYAIDSLSYRLQHVDTTGTAHTANETGLQFSAPERIVLRPPFPNPARQHATLHFGLSSTTEVQITIYDLLGRSVRTPVRGRFEAGRHQKRLTTSGLAPGMYFVRMRAGNTTRTRKLTVLR